MMHLIKHIHWRYSTRVKVFAMFISLYVLAGIISSFDFAGRASNIFCALLTLGTSVACFIMSFYVYRLAKKIEYSKKWLCTCCCRDSAKLVLLGYIFTLVTLGLLKLWSITDLFLFHWSELPISYHAQAWAYLASNASWILMAYFILDIFEAKYTCAQKERIFVPEGIK